jgi:hypothetical protein
MEDQYDEADEKASLKDERDSGLLNRGVRDQPKWGAQVPVLCSPQILDSGTLTIEEHAANRDCSPPAEPQGGHALLGHLTVRAAALS